MSRQLLIDALRSPVRPTVSVEFFPPKDAEGGARMLKVAATLRPLGIDFASLTYGAGGTSRDTTITYGAELVKMGIPKGAVYETKLVSPAKAEKLTWEKRDGAKVSLSERQLKRMEQEYVVKLAGKLTVVPESDSRPAVITNAAPLFSAVEAAPAAESLPSWLL